MCLFLFRNLCCGLCIYVRYMEKVLQHQDTGVLFLTGMLGSFRSHYTETLNPVCVTTVAHSRSEANCVQLTRMHTGMHTRARTSMHMVCTYASAFVYPSHNVCLLTVGLRVCGTEQRWSSTATTKCVQLQFLGGAFSSYCQVSYTYGLYYCCSVQGSVLGS